MLRGLGQAQGWQALESWTLGRLVSEFDTAAGAPLVNVRVSSGQNVLQCNRQAAPAHPRRMLTYADVCGRMLTYTDVF